VILITQLPDVFNRVFFIEYVTKLREKLLYAGR